MEESERMNSNNYSPLDSRFFFFPEIHWKGKREVSVEDSRLYLILNEKKGDVIQPTMRSLVKCYQWN